MGRDLRPNDAEERSQPVVHVAGSPERGVQKCLRCGEVLTDNRDTMVQTAPGEDDPGPLWWGVGAFVTVAGSVSRQGWTEDGTLCEEKPE